MGDLIGPNPTKVGGPKVKDTFSVFHTNIRSLPYNGENLHNLLASLEFKFDVIALSGTWNPD